MEDEDELRERAHGNVDALVANLVQSYQRILRHLKLNTAEGALNDALQKNLLIKISAESIMHSCRKLLQLCADLSLSEALHDLPKRLQEIEGERKWLVDELEALQQYDDH
ncbi:unnamed protein product [Vitrella brassicaformis CCMP3155]|uniref:Mediator of RNA polymerase II transcription subunit 22 n=1 Tax=Vitrella brassicaformis (strain CCMP3155) TaxID=1169540 RepID=A0A0G4GLG8_VITBC|nr:unnamed protein product [Vitrella brassicaformis CCMP3155]|eukprot:CEM30962.1 unnamed protein product [Vitrella brassicaformis CCMP3155]